VAVERDDGANAFPNNIHICLHEINFVLGKELKNNCIAIISIIIVGY
jgi:hypothetical protein